MNRKNVHKEDEMKLFSKINDQFESLYNKEEIQITEVTTNDIAQIIDIARIPIPEMLKSILEEGVIYGIKIRDTSIIINFCYAVDIINVNDNYPCFKEDVKEGIIFATDLGDNVYYYGNGREGIGLYIVGAGDGDFYGEATKFANTFEDFFIEGIGIDILKAY